MLYIIGIGLDCEKDITVKGLEAVKQADYIYLESYTSILNKSVSELEKFYGKKIIPANRDLVESKTGEILAKAKKENVAFLVIGDPFSATTHIDLYLSAKKSGIKTKVINNASVLAAVGITGLQLYKFGKTTSIPFPQENFMPETPYDILKENLGINAHTLLLLDLKPSENKFMSISEGINYLWKIELLKNKKIFTQNTFCIACSKLGSSNCIIKAGKAKDIAKEKLDPPVCLIVPAQMHFVEEESVKRFAVLS